jgi:hypothetical protein
VEDMISYRWNIEKERKLQRNETRNGITFADCAVAISEGRILDVREHPTLAHQRLAILEIENYAYVVPFVVEEDGTWFLKTVYPSRKYTALYFGKNTP